MGRAIFVIANQLTISQRADTVSVTSQPVVQPRTYKLVIGYGLSHQQLIEMFFRRFVSTASRRLPPTIHQLLAQEPEPQTVLSVTGHIKSVRKQKRVAFAAVNDGSCPEGLQAVLSPDDAHAFVIPSPVGCTPR